MSKPSRKLPPAAAKSPLEYRRRDYRALAKSRGLVSFTVKVMQTDMCIHAQTRLAQIARDILLTQRGYLEAYIRQYPEFARTLTPWDANGPCPMVVSAMIQAGALAGVGPMAAVAGALAEAVGKALLSHTDRVIVENGGDVFLKMQSPVTVGIFAGDSPLSMRIGMRFEPDGEAFGICTSSGTIGHSLSLGTADAVCVVSKDCALADAAATAVGNRLHTQNDIPHALAWGRQIPGVEGLAVIKGDRIGAAGQIELVPLEQKRG